MTLLKSAINLNIFFGQKKTSRYTLVTDFNDEPNGPFNRLPDELIIYILSQSALSIHTLHHMMKISKRMFHLCLHVLVQYKFPLYVVEATIDQEGHSRSLTHFIFQGIHADTLSFAVRAPLARRYYTNREVPKIRRMVIKDCYDSQSTKENAKLCLSIGQVEDKVPVTDKEDDKTSSSSVNTVNVKAMADTRNKRIHKVKMEGIHYVQVFQPLLQKCYFAIQNRLAWKFGYRIDKKTKKEYSLTPLYVDIQFSYFIELIKDKGAKKKFL